MKVELDGNTVCGLYCLQHLARKAAAARPDEIARAGGMGKERVRRTLKALERHGLVTAQRTEGWRLALPAGEITVSDVQEAMKELAKSGRPCRIEYETCPYRSVCPLTPVCGAVHEGVQGALASCDLGVLAQQAPSLPTCMEVRTRASRSK